MKSKISCLYIVFFVVHSAYGALAQYHDYGALQEDSEIIHSKPVQQVDWHKAFGQRYRKLTELTNEFWNEKAWHEDRVNCLKYNEQSPAMLEIYKDLPLIIITGFADIECAIAAMDQRTKNDLLVNALKVGMGSLVCCLLKHKANPNRRATSGGRLLHSTIVQKFGIKMMRLFLLYGADVNALDGHHKTPLMIALSQEFLNVEHMVQILNEENIDYTIQDDQGDTLLHWAVRKKKHLIDVIVSNAPSCINMQNNLGKTPLHCASSDLRCKKEKTLKAIIEKLLTYGGDRSIIDNDGKTAYDCSYYPEARKWLQIQKPTQKQKKCCIVQ